MQQLKLILASLMALYASARLSEADYFYRQDRPLVIAHRGAHGHFPEHTIASYSDAYYAGADFIELDLQITKDGQLLAQHDAFLDDSTNVELYNDTYADRRHEDGKFYVQDFTLAELKNLRRRQHVKNRSQQLNDLFELLTLQEVIDTVKSFTDQNPRTVNTERPVGLYIELKEVEFNFEKTGMDMVELLDEVLLANELSSVSDCSQTMPIIVQSFELPALEKYATLSDLPLIYLTEYEPENVPDWESISQVVHGIGADNKWVLLANNSDSNLVEDEYSSFITQMHDLDLAVHPYGLLDDNLEYRSNPYDETKMYVAQGIDGVFTEFPHTATVLMTSFGSKANFPAQELALQ